MKKIILTLAAVSALTATAAATPGGAVLGLPCGHWVMISRPEAFHARVRAWLWGEA